MTDHSRKEDRKGTNRHRTGTPLDLVQSHQIPNREGKVLNALEFPMPYPPAENAPPLGLASDVVAFQASAGMQHCPVDEMFPFSSTRWGLAATSGAYHKLHMDCSGFATYVNVKAGSKWWIIGRLKDGLSLADTTLFTNDYHIDVVNTKKFDFEAIQLIPNMAVYVICVIFADCTVLIRHVTELWGQPLCMLSSHRTLRFVMVDTSMRCQT